MASPPRIIIISALALLLNSSCALVRWTVGGHVTRVDAPLPADFPVDGFSHTTLEGLLRRFSSVEGTIDYASWHADAEAVAALDSYVAAIAAYSPENAPERFPKENNAFVYWVQAYNALVIKAVLDGWPLESVTDVRSGIEYQKGYGFFYGQRFIVGGRKTNLYDLEHDKLIRDDVDARVHFVLNCGSAGCPAIRPELPTGDDLEAALAQAARDFIGDPRNVHIDDELRLLSLSSIFQWYEEDFLNDLRHAALPAERGIVDYLIAHGPPELRARFEVAADYEVRFVDYDWTINSIEGGVQ